MAEETWIWKKGDTRIFMFWDEDINTTIDVPVDYGKGKEWVPRKAVKCSFKIDAPGATWGVICVAYRYMDQSSNYKYQIGASDLLKGRGRSTATLSPLCNRLYNAYYRELERNN